MLKSMLQVPNVLLNVSEAAPAPSRDFCQLQITKTEVIYRWWHISPRNMGKYDKPGEIRSSYDDFLSNEKIQNEVWRVFGAETFEYVKGVCKGQLNYIQYLPKPLLIRILALLNIDDVSSFASTCRQFRELSRSEELWEALFLKKMHTKVSNKSIRFPELQVLAQEVGWKRLYFTNSEQLHFMLNDLRQKITATSKSTARSLFVHLKEGEEEEVELDKVLADEDKGNRLQNSESKLPSINVVKRAQAENLKNLPITSRPRHDGGKKIGTREFPERPETVFTDLPPELRHLEGFGPAAKIRTPQLHADEDDFVVIESDKAMIDERMKQERVKAWLSQVEHPAHPSNLRRGLAKN